MSETNQATMMKDPLAKRIADGTAAKMGSWGFIVAQLTILTIWFAWNTLPIIAPSLQFDKYPFILANLFMSAEAAFSTPLLLMAANRQAAADRETFIADLRTDNDTHDLVEKIANKLGVDNGTIQ